MEQSTTQIEKKGRIRSRTNKRKCRLEAHRLWSFNEVEIGRLFAGRAHALSLYVFVHK